MSFEGKNLVTSLLVRSFLCSDVVDAFVLNLLLVIQVVRRLWCYLRRGLLSGMRIY